jgi:hypothetical protein
MAKLAATALAVLLGFGTGWVAGKALSGALINSTRAGKYSAPEQPQLEPQPSDLQSQPPEREPRRAEHEGIIVQIPTDAHSAKELGRQALKEILKGLKHHKHPGKHKD